MSLDRKIVLLSWRPIQSVHNEEMTTPYPSFETNDESLQPIQQPIQQYSQSPSQAHSQHNQEHESLIDNTQQIPHFNSRTMSPRIPRKRQNHNSKDEDYDGDFELEKAAISPNSGAGRSYSGMEVTSTGGSFRHKNPTNWNIDIEREDEIPLSPENRRQEPDYEEPEKKDKRDKHKSTGVDVSLYTTKKNVAQGMLDIALLSANCSQLKYLLFHYERDTSKLTAVSAPSTSSSSPSMMNWFTSMDFYFIINLICIGLSIGLQIIVGILLIMNGRHNIYVHRYQRVADSYSNLILCTVFIITIVNIFLSVFISAR